MSKQRALRIFVVDDESLIAFTLTTILRKSGYMAFSFTNPLEAMRCALVEAPDLLISDVMMPELSGVELAVEMKRACPGCSILLLSGMAYMEDLLAEARAQGHVFQLQCKPVPPADILRWVQGQVQRQDQLMTVRPCSCVVAGVSLMVLDSARLPFKAGGAVAF